MSFYTTTTPQAFHGASTTKRGSDSLNEESYQQQEERSNKRIKISSSPQPAFYGSGAFQSQPFQAPIQFTSPSGSTYFTYGGQAQGKKQRRA
ncbi:unnamed protein product [Cylindrotheca closterium]|uniref:Uncharacterized protein n=1 Tax=Cylindrotheca closterium TaxID=2856 RepID=A0AAD2FY17_9STRA|nr:unnamed protein product [Cylindrotheca closterium]